MNKLSTGVIHMLMKPVGLAQDYARLLTALLPSTLVGEPVSRLARRRCLVVLGVLCVMGITPAHATEAVKQSTSIDSLKLYAHQWLDSCSYSQEATIQKHKPKQLDCATN